MGEITELRGKVRADLRNEQVRRLLKAWEERRDELYDEISYRKGQVELFQYPFSYKVPSAESSLMLIEDSAFDLRKLDVLETHDR